MDKTLPKEKEIKKEDDEGMKKRYIFTLGALLGGAAALFLTPRSGKDLQADVLKKVEELQEKIKEFDQEAFKATCQTSLAEIKQTIAQFDLSESKQFVEGKFHALNERVNDLKAVIDEHHMKKAASIVLSEEVAEEDILETFKFSSRDEQ